MGFSGIRDSEIVWGKQGFLMIKPLVAGKKIASEKILCKNIRRLKIRI